MKKPESEKAGKVESKNQPAKQERLPLGKACIMKGCSHPKK
jgi:hypothetical protein